MNRNIQIGSRFVVFTILILALAFVLSQSQTGQAAKSQNDLTGNDGGAHLERNIIQSVSLNANTQQENPPGVDPELVRQLRQNARGQVSISARGSTGFASFVRVSRAGDLLPASQRRAPKEKAAQFLREYGRLFGVRDENSELALVDAPVDALGMTHLAYQQVYNGVPVFAGVLNVHQDAQGNLYSVNGAFVPDLIVNTTPSFSAETAAGKAIQDVLANPPKDDGSDAVQSYASSDLSIESNILYVYRDGLIQDMPGPNLLVYAVKVVGPGVREMVFVNAQTGKVVNRYSLVQQALFRRLFEKDTSTQVWQEGDPFPGTLNFDQQNIVTFSGNAYHFFFNAFGRDSYDAAGAEMQSVNNDPRINCPNANWNGLTTNYCNGVTSDDVVAHEWGHAYTEYTSNLIYQWQPGALNESYSDIWGESVDQLNGLGTDAPAPVRSANICSIYTAPIPLLRINSPASIAGNYAAGSATFGPPLTAAGITGDVVLADDGAGVTSDACTALVNGGAVSGKIALVDRGSCAFTIKVKNAQNAGAIGVIVADNVAGPVTGMSGSDPTITISSLRVTLETGNLIKSELSNVVNATLTINSAGAPENSYRWLMGEDSSAFGGAIRDMWAPTCKSDPGKVSDTQYQCTASDSGGVHTNSGVPNHGFALLTDGGTYNGQTVSGLGLVKAVHIYWRAQSVYQTPTSNFVDHADALETSCNDLIGVPLEGLSTASTPAGPSGQSITAADCGEVSKVVAAVELRLDPTAQCNFQPILQPNPPAVCSTGNPTSIYKEDFEEGLKGWTLTNQGVFSGWPGLDWVRSKDLPGGRNGPAAFGADPNAGNCDGGAGDISGSMSMESPAIKIPAGKSLVPYLTYNHYVATEAGWDGGNLKISVNGGPFTLVPASAYTFNPYNTTLNTAEAGNTNPLAGQPAFSGTDGGQVFSTWGQSQINLSSLGVKPGDTIRLRYDMGMDGCTGIDGWYVDDVNVVGCKAK